jgi:ABC-type branched-chain amino acid transport system, permease component
MTPAPLERLLTALRTRLDAARGLVGDRRVTDGGTVRSRASDLRVVAGLVLGLYVLFLVLSWFGGFQNAEAITSRLQSVTLLALVYVMLALALNLQWGYAGLLNLGVAGFAAVGVYTMALLSLPAEGLGLGLPLPVGMLGGFLAATLLGALAALPAIRLRADYLAIVTLAFSEIIRLIIRSRPATEFTIAGQTLGTGGTESLDLPSNPVKRLLYENPDQGAFIAVENPTVIGDPLFTAGEAVGFGPSLVERVVYTVMLLFVALLFYWLLVRVGNSPFGRVLKAIREDELVASSLGKDTRRFKIIAFAVGCGLIALTGMLWQMRAGGSTAPATFEPELTFFVFVALILGGSGSNTGSVVGGIVFVALLLEAPSFIQRIVDTQFGVPSPPDTLFDALTGVDPFLGYMFADDNISALRFVVLGIVLVYLMQNRPEGLFGGRTEEASTVDLSERPESTEAES